MASIIVVAGRSRGYCFPLPPEPQTVGREEDCHLQVVDEQVSRHHLRIEFDEGDGAFAVTDLGSSNGTVVNDARISAPTLLRDGDIIHIGESKLLFTEREFPDFESAVAFFKERGQRGKSTVIAPPKGSGSSDADDS